MGKIGRKKSLTLQNQILEMNTYPKKWSLNFIRCVSNEPKCKWYS